MARTSFLKAMRDVFRRHARLFERLARAERGEKFRALVEQAGPLDAGVMVSPERWEIDLNFESLGAARATMRCFALRYGLPRPGVFPRRRSGCFQAEWSFENWAVDVIFAGTRVFCAATCKQQPCPDKRALFGRTNVGSLAEWLLVLKDDRRG